MYVNVYELDNLNPSHYMPHESLKFIVCVSISGLHRVSVADASRVADGHGVRFSHDGERTHLHAHTREHGYSYNTCPHGSGHTPTLIHKDTYTYAFMRLCKHIHNSVHTQAALYFERYGAFPFTQLRSLVSHSLATQVGHFARGVHACVHIIAI